MNHPTSGAERHRVLIDDQFSRQAERFAASPALHNEAALNLLVDASGVRGDDQTLDVACGPGTVVAAFARRARRSVGLDATEAMLDQARALAAKLKLANVAWYRGDVYELPFAAASFDVVSCRFAFHHLQDPARALAEMIRVCRIGGAVVLCDGLASDDPKKAAALNSFERFRDPSTVEFRPLQFHLDLLAAANLTLVRRASYEVPIEREAIVGGSFPEGDDREELRQMINEAVEGDRFGMNARRDGDTVRMAYRAVVLVATPTAA
ncbi:MAG: methyltransferase domain-containing protein [Alphaproteobacteria bacterium]|nr:methyltransferase domain-containing protein [Alphaproteobacteria bacterium]